MTIEKRVIKKYPNRRLYDTEISKYITLEDVRTLVLQGVDFCVKDVKTDEDLTRSILLQIISEQEHDGDPMFSTRTLTQLIRAYGNAYQAAIASYYKKDQRYPASLEALLEDKRYPMPVRHLRKLYADPMTGEPDWMLIDAPGGKAEGLLNDILSREPDNAEALAWLGALALGKHEFALGLELGQRALAADPDLLAAFLLDKMS